MTIIFKAILAFFSGCIEYRKKVRQVNKILYNPTSSLHTIGFNLSVNPELIKYFLSWQTKNCVLQKFQQILAETNDIKLAISQATILKNAQDLLLEAVKNNNSELFTQAITQGANVNNIWTVEYNDCNNNEFSIFKEDNVEGHIKAIYEAQNSKYSHLKSDMGNRVIKNLKLLEHTYQKSNLI